MSNDNSTDPSAADPSAADPSAADPSAAGPSAADSSAAGPSAADPSAADPSAAGPSAAPDSQETSPSEQPPSAKGRFAAWWGSLLNKEAFVLPDRNPLHGEEPSNSEECVASAAEARVEDWEDEWDQPTTSTDPLTPEEEGKFAPLQFDLERKKNWIGFGVVFALCSLLYLPFIGAFGLWDPWETHYGEVARHMVETRDFISPWWGSHWVNPEGGVEGKGFFSKPILIFWSMAMGMEIWGWSEIGIRFGVALMSIFGVAMTYMMGASVWSRRVGFIMAGVLSTSPFFFFLSRQTQTDMPFVAMLLVAMAFFMMAAFGKHRKRRADRLHLVLFIGAMLCLVLPQLVIIGSDTGFSEEQRAIRPHLRTQSMNDFKGAKAWDQFVGAKTPHLSPLERSALQDLSPAEADKVKEGALGIFPDHALEMFPAYIALFLAFAAFFGMFLLWRRDRLGARFWRAPDNHLSAMVLTWGALGCLSVSLVLHFKRLYDAYALNWETEFGAGFNLLKFSGVGLNVAFVGLVGAMLFVLHKSDPKKLTGDSKTLGPWLRRGPVLIASVVLLLLVASAPLLFMKGRALGVNGLSFWENETFTFGRVFRLTMISVYVPIFLGFFLGIGALLFFTKGERFWKTRSAALIWPLFVSLGAIIFMCVSTFYIPVFAGPKGPVTFGQAVAGPVIGGFFQWGPIQILIYLGCMVAVFEGLFRSKRKTIGHFCFLAFYIFAALATMAKGLLGFALPGAIALIYLIVTSEWKRLKEFEIPRGILTFIAVGFPWYAAMLILHGMAYFNRFFIHDHFKRLASGVHQIDSGTIEHFVQWLAYGLFPWVAFIPAVLFRLGSGRGLLLKDDRSRATLMLAIWATFSFALFSVSSTKFHHYIFPVVPPLALLISLLLDELLEGKMKRFAPIALISVAGMLVIGFDVINDPQHWKNLFTYKYDRIWIDQVPEFTAYIFGEATLVQGFELNEGFKSMTAVITGFSVLGAAAFFFRSKKARLVGFIITMGAAVTLTVWGLNVYMPGISPTWSQRGVWMAYWDDCTKVEAPPNADPNKIWCAESSLVYKTTWRGEHYYSQNESVPLIEDGHLEHFLKSNGDEPFYFMVDRARYCGGSTKTPNFGDQCKGQGSIVGMVRKHYSAPKYQNKLAHELVWDENFKFIMIKIYPLGREVEESKKSESKKSDSTSPTASALRSGERASLFRERR